MLTKTLVNKFIPRIGYRRILIGNTLALGVMIASFSLIDNQLPYGVLLGWLMVFGAINSLQFSAMNTLTLQDLSLEFASSGNGLLSVVMQLHEPGVAIAASLLGLFSAGSAAADGQWLGGFHHLPLHRPDVDAGGADLRPAGARQALSRGLRGRQVAHLTGQLGQQPGQVGGFQQEGLLGVARGPGKGVVGHEHGIHQQRDVGAGQEGQTAPGRQPICACISSAVQIEGLAPSAALTALLSSRPSLWVSSRAKRPS